MCLTRNTLPIAFSFFKHIISENEFASVIGCKEEKVPIQMGPPGEQ
jgi:hypothetical protein